MNVGLYEAASAMSANARWQEIIAENLAASVVPGHKRQDVTFTSVEAGLQPQATGSPQRFVMPHVGATTNFSPGEMKRTDVKTDVALEGPGFMAVQLPDGNVAYTRDGEFQINSSGLLVNKQGHPVLGESGPIQLDLQNYNALSISSTGDVSQGSDLKGKLKVADFSNPAQLTSIGRGYFLANDPSVQPREATETRFRQFFIETSNASSVLEMTNLISALRSFEANQKVIQTHDERLGRVIQELGNPS
jgi:flagellar basal body rod protein FlgG